MRIVDKIKHKVIKEKHAFVIYGIVWFIMDLFLIAPMAVASKMAVARCWRHDYYQFFH